MSISFKKLFSSRSSWENQLNSLSIVLKEKRRSGAAIIDLTESNPTRGSFSFHSEPWTDALLDKKNDLYEPDPRGLFHARQAVCDYYAAKKITLDPEQIFLTAGTSEGYSFLMRLLLDLGDVLLCAEPSYPLMDTLSEIHDVVPKKYALRRAPDWRIDQDPLSEGLHCGARALVLVNPNNPTGNFVSPEEKRKINGLCAKVSCALIVDEVFLDYAWDKARVAESFASNEEVLTFTLSGISKVLALPQMKVSWIVVSGPRALREEALARLEIIADAYLSVNTPCQHALGTWLSRQNTVQEEILARVRANAAYLKKMSLEYPAIQMLPAQGGWYAVLERQGTVTDEQMALRLLNEMDVLVHPGFFYDFVSENILVLSLIVEESAFQEGARRIFQMLTP